MNIVPIFEPYLYAVRYKNELVDELERLFDEWSDIEKLEQFFESNAKDLGYYGISVEEAIGETLKESTAFRKNLIEIVEHEGQQLDAIFKNLNVNELGVYELVKQKSRRRWLRLYAIRIDTNVYMVTGGAIKLTFKMEERIHTQKELDKLERCRNYLKDNQVFDCDSFYEMLNEE